LASFRFERPMLEVYRAVSPFILVLLVCLGIVTYAPGLCTWSSRLVMPLRLESLAAQATDSHEARGAGSPAAGMGVGAGGDDLQDPSGEGETLETLMERAERAPERRPALPAEARAGDRLQR